MDRQERQAGRAACRSRACSRMRSGTRATAPRSRAASTPSPRAFSPSSHRNRVLLASFPTLARSPRRTRSRRMARLPRCSSASRALPQPQPVETGDTPAQKGDTVRMGAADAAFYAVRCAHSRACIVAQVRFGIRRITNSGKRIDQFEAPLLVFLHEIRKIHAAASRYTSRAASTPAPRFSVKPSAASTASSALRVGSTASFLAL